jgi:predicted DNA-binding protein (MmcQ/YjbR family)
MGANNIYQFSQKGNKVYDINGNMYVIDKETGRIGKVAVKDDPVPQEDLRELIKVLARNQRND